ncbi:hypothetical protein LTR37_020727 [Vermiconidia calcicola]|uniref:Uncharacterized protein n=1 Tax=Vermiconidia calcicola TaxID=1690605 RepID=A0ACC3MAL4_9PEZI|nr:hypothetical protein LTR37_020727 [Vermiconidia calcicola]
MVSHNQTIPYSDLGRINKVFVLQMHVPVQAKKLMSTAASVDAGITSQKLVAARQTSGTKAFTFWKGVVLALGRLRAENSTPPDRSHPSSQMAQSSSLLNRPLTVFWRAVFPGVQLHTLGP